MISGSSVEPSSTRVFFATLKTFDIKIDNIGNFVVQNSQRSVTETYRQPQELQRRKAS